MVYSFMIMEQLSLFANEGYGKSFRSICDALGCEGDSPAWPDRFGHAIKAWLLDNDLPPIRTLSLFSGAGGLDIGFSDVGFEIVESVEIEEKFCDTLKMNSGRGKRFAESKVNCIDIREYSAKHLGQVDFIIGGPPCQTFSAASRRANGVPGTTDARGVLFREYVRLLTELSPKGFLFENVYGIIGAQGGEAWREILQAFSQVGYRLFYRILDAADYGVPQHRERLIIVGLKEGSFRFPRPTHGPDSIDGQPFFNAETAIEGVSSWESADSVRLRGRFASLLDGIPPGLNYSFYTEEMGHPNPIFAWRSKFSDFLYKADPSTPVRTIKANGGAYTGPLHWENRFFTCEEYKRLQTFPDDYEISGSKQLAVRQIGNSVPPQLARMLAIAIRQQVFGTAFPFQLPLLEDDETLTFRKRKRELTSLYRKKAEMAIKALKKEPGSLPGSHTYYCSLSELFRFSILPAGEADFQADIRWDDALTVTVSDARPTADRPVYTIDLTSRHGDWAIGVGAVRLIVRTRAPLGYTAAWKAFEKELADNGIKADLVQLNGYYQYTPRMIAAAWIAEDAPYASVLRSVLATRDIPEIVSTEALADRWKIGADDVLAAAKYLRSLGYEIRDHNTNPQIEPDHWLVPYIFPTLTPLSVQLWKKL